MKQTLFTGCATALATPFTADGKKVDFKGFQKLLEFQLSKGISAFVVAGTTGEAPTLTASEKSELFLSAVSVAGGKAAVIAGTGSNNTEEAVRKSNAAEKEGVDGLLIVTPYYNKCTQEGIIKHYEFIADRVSTPVIIYDVPSRTGVSVAPETYKALSEHKNIVAIKEADSSISKFVKTVSLCGDSLDYYSGNDDLTTAMMSLGAKGVISVASNVIPDIMQKICECFTENRFAEGNEIFFKYLPLMNLLFCEVNPIPVKYALSLITDNGFGEFLRLPLSEMKSENKVKITKLMKELNIIK